MKKKFIIINFITFLILFISLKSFANPQIMMSSQVQYIMGTFFNIQVFSNNKDKADNAIKLAFKEIRKYDDILSNYKEDSELSIVIKNAYEKPVKISDELYNVLKESLDISELTYGYFDITIEPLVKLWGFKDKNFNFPNIESINDTKKLVNYRYLELNPYDKTLFITKKDVTIDFGGIGKGYAIDRAVEILKNQGINSGIISSKSNIYFLGSQPYRNTWELEIKHPRIENEIVKKLYLKDQAVSTSGDYEQFFTHNGIRYSHIIDPNTGFPIQNKSISCTVVYKNSSQADALSTSGLLLDNGKIKNMLSRFNNIYLIKVIKDGDKIQYKEYYEKR